MTDDDISKLQRENTYLKQRIAQLEGDIVDLNSQVTRLQQQNQHFSARRVVRPPDPLAGGQSG
jgi:predicted  nucleic acid-binding Zn-ribbon protein